MKIPYTFPAINDFLRDFLERNRNRVIECRPKFLRGTIPYSQWRELCNATAMRVSLAYRAAEMANSACGWIIAQALTRKLP